MSITPYVRPQDTITQILQQTAAPAATRRNPLVIGPQFELFLADGRDLSRAELTFLSAGAVDLSYKNAAGAALNLSTRTPQAAGAQLMGKDLQAEVASSAACVMNLLTEGPRVLRTASNLLAGDGILNTSLNGRSVRVGDVVQTDWATTGTVATGASPRRRVIGLLGKVTAATVAAAAPSVLNPVTQASDQAYAVASATTSGLDVTLAATLAAGDRTMIREAGSVALVGGAYKLHDLLEIVCTTPGAPTVAVFSVSSTVTGTTVSVTSGGSGSDYEISLEDLGYGATAEVIVTRTGSMVAAERIRVQLLPTFTPTAAATLFPTAGTYTPTVSRRYAIEIAAVDGSEHDINIYDVSGADAGVSYASAVAAGALNVGTSGVTVNPAIGGVGNVGVCVGQVFYIDCVAAVASTTQFDGVLLDGPIIPSISADASGVTGATVSNTKIYQLFSGPMDSSNTVGVVDPVTLDDTTWSYPSGLGLSAAATGRSGASFSAFVTGFGKVYLSYKALVKATATESIIPLTSIAAITSALGEVKLDNWLARGALEAFNGNQGSTVYALRTNGDTPEDFAVALRKIRTTDRVYALAGMTDNLEVMYALRDHCTLMSDKFNRNFRRCYVGTDSPGEYLHWGALPGGGYRIGDLASSVVTLDEAYRAESQFVPTDVGSTITVQSIGQTYTILEVLSDYEVLTDAPSVLTQANSNLTLTRSDTAANAVLYVAARSAAFNSRRLINVWSDNPTVVENGVTKVLPMKFVAAEVAGLRCAMLPQQGLTMTEIKSAFSAPSMYTLFEPEQLDVVAASGTFIVTQESEGGDVFIRHQLTTSTSEGALGYEDNVGVIVDEFSYALKDEFRGYRGKRNATPDTISEMDDKLKALAISFTQSDLRDRAIGPMVLTFRDEKGVEGAVTIRQDGLLADTLMTYVKLTVPLAINGINHYVDVAVTELLASEDN